MTRPSQEASPIPQSVDVADTARIGSGVILNGRCTLGEHCQIDSGAILEAGSDGHIVIGENAHVQAGAIICGTVTVSDNAMVQAGAVVSRNVPAHAIVAGNPAQIIGYTLNAENHGQPATLVPKQNGQLTTTVRGVTLHRLPKIIDLRGNLTVGEFGKTIPFDAKRYFMVFGVPNAEVRGEHAHRTCHQFLVCARGSLAVVADDGQRREEFLLNDPSIGLHLPPLTWGIQYKYSADAVLLVFASEYYDSQEYIRDYSEFILLCSELSGHAQ